MMYKDEFVRLVAKNAGATIKATKPIVDAVFETLAIELAGRGAVQIMNFGTFETRTRKAVTRYNNFIDEEVYIPESVVPKFKPSERLINMVKMELN